MKSLKVVYVSTNLRKYSHRSSYRGVKVAGLPPNQMAAIFEGTSTQVHVPHLTQGSLLIISKHPQGRDIGSPSMSEDEDSFSVSPSLAGVARPLGSVV